MMSQARQWTTEESDNDSILLPRRVVRRYRQRLTKRNATTSKREATLNIMLRVPIKNYSHEEVMTMLELMEKILPIGTEEWEQVETGLRDKFPPGRDKNSITRKYHQLYRRKIPTGDPNMPPEVRLAKKVQRDIGIKACIGHADEPFDLTTGFKVTAVEETQQTQPLLGQPTQLTQETSELTKT